MYDVAWLSRSCSGQAGCLPGAESAAKPSRSAEECRNPAPKSFERERFLLRVNSARTSGPNPVIQGRPDRADRGRKPVIHRPPTDQENPSGMIPARHSWESNTNRLAAQLANGPADILRCSLAHRTPRAVGRAPGPLPSVEERGNDAFRENPVDGSPFGHGRASDESSDRGLPKPPSSCTAGTMPAEF